MINCTLIRLEDGRLALVSEIDCVIGSPREILTALHRHSVPEDMIIDSFIKLGVDHILSTTPSIIFS